MLILLSIYLFIGFGFSYEEHSKFSEGQIEGLSEYVLYYIVIPSIWVIYLIVAPVNYSIRKRLIYANRKKALNNGKFIKNY